MIRTKAMLISAAAAACLAGVAASSIGAAAAATSTTSTSTSTTTSPATTAPTTTPATITVNGAAIVTVDPSADVATQNAGYLGALGSAVTNAKTKATALATQVGDTLGAVQNITEQSSYSGGDFCGNPSVPGRRVVQGIGTRRRPDGGLAQEEEAPRELQAQGSGAERRRRRPDDLLDRGRCHGHLRDGARLNGRHDGDARR